MTARAAEQNGASLVDPSANTSRHDAHVYLPVLSSNWVTISKGHRGVFCLPPRCLRESLGRQNRKMSVMARAFL